MNVASDFEGASANLELAVTANYLTNLKVVLLTDAEVSPVFTLIRLAI